MNMRLALASVGFSLLLVAGCALKEEDPILPPLDCELARVSYNGPNGTYADVPAFRRMDSMNDSYITGGTFIASGDDTGEMTFSSIMQRQWLPAPSVGAGNTSHYKGTITQEGAGTVFTFEFQGKTITASVAREGQRLRLAEFNPGVSDWRLEGKVESYLILTASDSLLFQCE